MDGTHEVDQRAHVATWVQELCSLLEEQITRARAGHLVQIEPLQERTNTLVAQITSVADGDPCRMGTSRERVQKLYAELRLALMAQREETRAALHAVRRGKRMLKTYGNHISPV